LFVGGLGDATSDAACSECKEAWVLSELEARFYSEWDSKIEGLTVENQGVWGGCERDFSTCKHQFGHDCPREYGETCQ